MLTSCWFMAGLYVRQTIDRCEPRARARTLAHGPARAWALREKPQDVLMCSQAQLCQLVVELSVAVVVLRMAVHGCRTVLVQGAIEAQESGGRLGELWPRKLVAQVAFSAFEPVDITLIIVVEQAIKEARNKSDLKKLKAVLVLVF